MGELSSTAKNELLKLARKAIEEYILRGKKTEPLFTDELKEMRGAFVTLVIGNELRGCIGYVIPIQNLANTVIDCAIAAAVEDPRFSPLKPKEVNKIKIEISVLSPLKKVKSIDEIEIGKHGIMLTRGFNRGLLLPQVATEHNMDKITFLENTCYKAGLDKEAWKDKDTILEIFSAEIFSE
ncbi:MAG: hypothetical protein A2Y62_15520 [Candidatus Fischerbacteria bacterium RBG_13_37_8]|uniref:AMMECR1 domain-containing protein n=1 Tax=Candidatus Fischerbacteria bacterium RBG_13_37_8 TaxID=1817863 RepID=A0A1F5VKS8_9BACT|nr:MAG: hypothetical protein A2Y62_15520 [Candidatus Fischerbacteria bacterium RBG_13_37_8]